MELIINETFKNLLDLPSPEELKELESQLRRDGRPRDPLIIWQGHNIIVDGHNRYNICKAHNLDFTVREMEFADEKAVTDFILENQLARRNLTPAKVTYYLGMLYNNSKQQVGGIKLPNPDGKTTAEIIAEKHGVNEKTVRRAGDEVKGIDTIAKVKGLNDAALSKKLAALKDKNTGTFTKAETAEIGKLAEADPKLAEETTKVMIEEKKITEKAAEVKKRLNKAPAPLKKAAPVKEEKHSVVFARPSFERSGFSVTTEMRPVLADNAIVYMVCDDEQLATAMKLMDRWGLEYEATFVFKTEQYEGTVSNVQHQFMLVGTKGVMHIDPKVCTASLQAPDIAVDKAMIKLIEAYHPTDKRKLDMRKNGTKADGWL